MTLLVGEVSLNSTSYIHSRQCFIDTEGPYIGLSSFVEVVGLLDQS